MERSRQMAHVLLAAMMLPFLALLVACGGGGEQRLIQKYFNAARMRDDRTLSNIATVSYDPRQHGVVQNVRVVEVGEERAQPLRLRELEQAHAEAIAADKEFTERKQAYQNEHHEAIERVLRAEREQGTVARADAPVQEAWSRWRDETGQHARQVAEARQRLERARASAEVSVLDLRTPVDLRHVDGDLISKDVTIDATVRSLEGGESQQRRMVVTMERAVLRDEQDNKVNGRWLITNIRDTAQAAGAPTS
jgi:hypothetical protein